MTSCACGSGSAFSQCCEPYLTKTDIAPSAEALMRSRYTAFTKADIDYIQQTHHPKTRSELDLQGTEQWAKSADWQGLEIIKTVDGQQDDQSGEVEFKARYRVQGELCVLHEVSQFERKQGKWYYVDGKLPEIKQYRRETPKQGRNDPCSCGSGRKYKKCCGGA